MKENEQKIEQSENELNEEDLEQVQGGLMRKPNVPDNSDEKEKPSVNPAEAGGPFRFFILE
ncbi:MAG: bacteriocin [Solobacterium sp.]|nr:bacteriocin [Solobacterium sp.]